MVAEAGFRASCRAEFFRISPDFRRQGCIWANRIKGPSRV